MVSSALQVSSPRLVVLGELASGGMGTVWLAHIDGHLERLVALKRMHKHLASEPEFLNMFLDEICLTGALRHPNIVDLVGWGIDDRGPYFATEFVLGASLSTLKRGGRASQNPLPVALVMHVGAEIARGLHAAYTHTDANGSPLRIVHRDLTPGNVLVGTDGAVKLTDFGVAQAARKIVKTRTGVLKGKAHYISPEYVRGGQQLDARSDLYSLGVVMFELLAGRRPYGDVSEFELLTHVARHDPPPLREAVDADPELAALVDALRANQPQGRPSSAATVAEQLESMLSARGFPADIRTQRLGDYVKVHAAADIERIEAIRTAAACASGPLDVLRPEHTMASATQPRPSETSGVTHTVSTTPASHGEAPISYGRAPASQGATPTSTSGTRAVAYAAASAVAQPPTPSAPLPVRRRTGSVMFVVVATVSGAAVGGGLVALLSRPSLPNPASAPAHATTAEPQQSAAAASTTLAPAVSSTANQASTTTTISTSRLTARPAERPNPTTKPATRAPRNTTHERPPRKCTPMDFDYPNCKG